MTVGGIVASSSGQITTENPIQWNFYKFDARPINPFFLVIIASVIAGVLAGVIAGRLTKKWQNYHQPEE